jgi:simple sugar transport system permease protein
VTSGSPDKTPATTEATAAEARATRPEDRGGTPPERHDGFLYTFLANLWSANTVAVTVLAIVLALVIGAILIIVSDPNVLAAYRYFFAAPGDALSESSRVVGEAFANLFKGAVVDPEVVSDWLSGATSFEQVVYPISETLTYAAPLTFTGLAFALAFRGGLFNIGVQGQAILGSIGAGLIGLGLGLPPVLHVVVALLGAVLAGGFWGYVPGILKARTGAHEVITTIMLNYVALYFIGWLIIQQGVHDPTRSEAISKPIADSAKLTDLPGASLRANVGILLAIATCAGVAWLLNRGTFGFELRAVGANPDAARTAGMSVARTYVLVMAISGALSGLGGATLVLGTAHNLTIAVVGQIGFNGLLVALLGRAKPWGVLAAAVLFGALQAGGNRMQTNAAVSVELVTVLQALIVMFIAAPALVKTTFQLRAARAARLETSVAKGW